MNNIVKSIENSNSKYMTLNKKDIELKTTTIERSY